MSAKCKRCGGVKLTYVSGKTANLCCTKDLDTGTATCGYTIENQRLAKIQDGGDYLRFTFCVDCGTIQELYSSTWRGNLTAGDA